MRRGLFFALALGLALVATLPLRLAVALAGLDEAALTARAASGTIWAGRLQEARLGPLPLGDLDARLELAPLLLGRARLALAGEGLSAAATATPRSFGIDDATGRLALGGLLAPLPLDAIELDGVTVRFADGLCIEAQGELRARPGALAGRLRCDGGALGAALAGAGGESLAVSLRADGAYAASLSLPGGSAPLQLNGRF